MSIIQFISPLNLPSIQSTNIRVNYNISAQLPSQPPQPPQPQPNPYNSRCDGFITTMITGGIGGKNMGKIVFDDTPVAEDGISKKMAVFQKVGATVGIDAAIYGGLSILKQGIGLATGKQDAAGAAANITTDILRGGSTGLGACLGGGLTGLAMRALGSTGTFGTVITVIGGMVGASIGGNLLEATGLRGTLVEKFGSKKAMVA